LRKVGAGDKGKCVPHRQQGRQNSEQNQSRQLCRLLWIKCDKSIRKMPLKDFAAQLVARGIEATRALRMGTPKGDVFITFLKRNSPVYQKGKRKNLHGRKG
jgi:hypothetical protein